VVSFCIVGAYGCVPQGFVSEARSRLYYSPYVLCGVAELAARYTGTEIEVADTDGVVLDGIGEVIAALGHGTDENTDALVLVQALDVVAHSDDLGIETEGDLPAVRGEMVCDRILNDLDELLLGGGGADHVSVEQLYHETGKALESSGYPDGRADLDQYVFVGLDVDLELSSLVDRRIQ
jgi:hypothetical protein